MSQRGRGRPKKRARNISGLKNQGSRPLSAPPAADLLNTTPDSRTIEPFALPCNLNDILPAMFVFLC
jgi:hypothetical protein